MFGTAILATKVLRVVNWGLETYVIPARRIGRARTGKVPLRRVRLDLSLTEEEEQRLGSGESGEIIRRGKETMAAAKEES